MVIDKYKIEMLETRKKQISQISKKWKNRTEIDRAGNKEILTLEKVAARMLSNMQYDPYDPYCLPWDYHCHPEYAISSLRERYSYFAQWVRIYKKHIQGRVYGDSGSVIVDAVTKADKGMFLYEDWILAQICFFLDNCWIHHLRGPSASKIAKYWIQEGRYIPAILMIDFD